MKELLQQLQKGQPLAAGQAEAAFAGIMEGTADPLQVSALLTMLALREPTADELYGAALVMRRHVLQVQAPPGTIDTCGTGGVGSNLFNVSTTAALVAAACGVPVAKHGNRSVTSKSGSADVLRVLGVNVDTTPEQEARCLREARICFAFAVRHHPAMKHVADVRRALGFGTIFNTLGPLTNPAGVRRQLIGVRSPEMAEKLLDVMIRLGAERVMLVSGEDHTDSGKPLRICELSISGPTYVATWDGHKRHGFCLRPEEVGMATRSSVPLGISSPEQSAELVTAVLAGQKGAARDIVLLNAAACLWVGDKVHAWNEALECAAEAIDTGAAREALATLVRVSRS